MRQRIAFTLMELLVALGIFAISVGAIGDLFLSASRQQAQTVTAGRVQDDARLVLETIARELREGTFDFRLGIPASALAMRSRAGELVRFERVASGDAQRPCPGGAPACIYIGRGTDAAPLAWAPLTSADVDAEAFHFWKSPDADPAAWDPGRGAYAADIQPRVTVYLRLKVVGARPGTATSLEAQTTVASRMYRR